jgi:cell wall-associated NlpC family hydrolase
VSILLLVTGVPTTALAGNDVDSSTVTYDANDGNSFPEFTTDADEATENEAEEQEPTQIVQQQTTVAGLPSKIKEKSRGTIILSVTVAPANGRSAYLQMYKSGNWVTKRTVSLANTDEATFSLIFTNDWWTVSSSEWRVMLPETETGTSYTSSTIVVTTTRYYQNPAKYVQIQDDIKLIGGNYKLKIGYMGLKVRKVNRYFHTGNKHWPRYTTTTARMIKQFQKKKKLKVTGVVDKITWLKMGFSSKSWNELGAYVSRTLVNPSSTKSEHIEAMISRAYDYLGSDYVVGASGTPAQGADCSGLVMQAMYAAGVSLDPIGSVRHSKRGYEYESRNMWASKKLKTIPYSKKKRGDLIFYKGRGGAVVHVAIYLGNGKVIESWPNKVVIWPIKNSQRNNIKGVKRVFN